MSVPTWWPTAVLSLAAFRISRIIGWDEFSLAVRVRDWLTGAEPSDAADAERRYRRPTLAHLVGCTWCLGWWTSLAVYGAWLGSERITLYVCYPFAVSAIVGLVAKQWDP